jgi:hypothetical protein
MDNPGEQRNDWISNLILERKGPAHRRSLGATASVSQEMVVAVLKQTVDIRGLRPAIASQNVSGAVRKDHELPGCDRSCPASLFQLDPYLTALNEMKMSAVPGPQPYCPRRSELAVTEDPSFELKSVQNVSQHIRNCTSIIKLHV